MAISLVYNSIIKLTSLSTLIILQGVSVIVVIKINQPDLNGQDLILRAQGDWKIKLDKVKNEKRAIILYKGVILMECDICDVTKSKDIEGRVSFVFKKVINSQLENLKIKYPTSYPCTITKEIVIKVI